MEKYLNVLNLLLAKLPINLYWMDTEAKVVLCNDNQARAFGLKTAEDLIDKSIFEIGAMLDWRPEIATAVFAHNKEIIETVIPHQMEEHFKLDGEEKTFLAHKMPWQDDSGKIIGIFGFTVDITERKQLELSLKVEKQKAEQANNVKSEFIKNMAHDFRTPFSGIYGLADFMCKQEADKEKKENLAIVSESAKILLDYANEIISFAEIEQQTIPAKADKINVRKLVNDLVKVESPAVKHKKLALETEITANVPKIVIGDEYRLRTILLNLLGNAIKFTMKGKIKLTVTTIGYIDSDCISLQISVKDTGIGLEANKINFVNEKFNRLTASYQGQYKGTGLGLPTIKQFLKDIDGEMYIDSKLKQGSTFTCVIPFKLKMESN